MSYSEDLAKERQREALRESASCAVRRAKVADSRMHLFFHSISDGDDATQEAALNSFLDSVASLAASFDARRQLRAGGDVVPPLAEDD